MSQVTVNEAAFLTGRSRQTINKFTKHGKLSFSLNGEQVKVIDVAELQRVFPLVRKIEDLKQMQNVGGPAVEANEGQPDLREQVAVLKARLESVSTERERERRQLESEIEHLRRSLEKVQEQHGRAMLLLTDQTKTGQERVDEQRERLEALAHTVEVLKRQNRRIYQELKGKPSRPFWRRFFG